MNIDQLYELLAINENLGIMLELFAKYGLTNQSRKLYAERKVTVEKFKTQEIVKYEVPVIQEIQSQDINKLITKYINEDYAYASFGNVEVVMMVSNNYINASKLCKLGGAAFKNWKKTQNAQKLINLVESREKITGSKNSPFVSAIIQMDSGISKKLSGSYVHPDLIVHVASWLSPEFALMVAKIVNNYIIAETERKNRLALKIKDDKIDELSKKLDYMINQNKNLESINLDQSAKINNLTSINLDQSAKINTLLNHTTKINDKLEYAKIGYVCTSKPVDDNVFVIFKNNPDQMFWGPNAICKKTEYAYSTMRLMKKSVRSRFSDHLKKYPNAKELITIRNPYANNLWNRLKNKLITRGDIETSYVDFNLKNGYSEEELINEVKQCNEERFKM